MRLLISLVLVSILVSPVWSQQGTTVPTLEEFKALVAENVTIKSKLVDIETRLSKLEQIPTPTPIPEPVPTTEKLLDKEDIEYIGAFRFPQAPYPVPDSANYSYGGTALSHNPTNDSLFVVGHDWFQRIGEIKPPTEIKNGSKITELTFATALQPAEQLYKRIPNFTLVGNVKVGGTLVIDNNLIGSLYEYYDGDGNAIESHFTVKPNNLASGKIEGLFKIGQFVGGYVGGYMAHVSPEWQEKLGCKYVTGLCGVAITSRTSRGPCIIGFDPNDWTKSIPLLYYPYGHGSPPPNYHPDDHPLEQIDPTAWSNTATVCGVIFPENTSSVLFFGSKGIGTEWYGSNGDYPNLNDPAIGSKGYHAYPYVYKIWAYDLNELVKVKNGLKKPWEIKPYKHWDFELPMQSTSRTTAGLCYDFKTRKIYFSVMYAGDWGEGVIHVLKVK